MESLSVSSFLFVLIEAHLPIELTTMDDFNY